VRRTGQGKTGEQYCGKAAKSAHGAKVACFQRLAQTAPARFDRKVASDDPIPYIERTRHYYRALGYSNDYEWACFDRVPFARLTKPLARARIGIVTTAGPPSGYPRDDNGLRHPWQGDTAEQPSRLATDMAWDRQSTHTDDTGSFLPIDVMKELAAGGTIGECARHFHGVPTEYSQRKTMEQDAPQVLGRLRDDGADAAILCPL
jgi:D-proline reductase (dithiol) PrdB